MDKRHIDPDKIIGACLADSENDPFVPICSTKLKEHCLFLEEKIEYKIKAWKEEYESVLALEKVRYKALIEEMDGLSRTLILGNTSGNPAESTRAAFVALERIVRISSRLREQIEVNRSMLSDSE